MGKLLEENDLLNKPEHILNVDESGMSMNCKNGKVVVKKEQIKPLDSNELKGSYHSKLLCVSQYTDYPFIIYEKAFPSAPYKIEGRANALYGKFENGYMEKVIFQTWFIDHFIKLTNHLSIRILIIDGHGSHIFIEKIQAIDNNEILYCLPPHTTHILQPLDVAVYQPLKAHFSKITDFIVIVTLGQEKKVTINKTNFAVIFKEAVEAAINTKIIINGFRTTGIYPFNSNAIKKRKTDANNTAALPSAPRPSSKSDSSTTSSLIEHENLPVTPMPNTSTNQSSNVSFSIDLSTPSCF